MGLLGWCPTAFALNPALDVSQYAHTSWKVRDGFVKGRVQAVAQTPDGYLWIGTDVGLFRFDGVRVVPFEPPPEYAGPPIRGISLLTSRDGTLWIASSPGLASWKDGRLTAYPELSSVITRRLVEDRAGRIWFISLAPQPRRVCSIEHGVVRCSEAGARLQSAASVFEDSNGSLWVGLRDGIARLSPGGPAFFTLPAQPNGYTAMAEENGELLVSQPDGLSRFHDGRTELVHPFPEALRPQSATGTLRDRDGGLWIGTEARGLARVRDGRTDVYRQADGLSGDAVFDVIEDREGSIWVATRGGVDRFSEPSVARISADDGLSNAAVRAVAATPEGKLWIATSDGLNLWEHGDLTIFRDKHQPTRRGAREIVGRGWPEREVQSLLHDAEGRLWFASYQGVRIVDHGRLATLGGPSTNTVSAIVQDAQHAVWLAGTGPLVRMRDGRVVESTALATLGVKPGDVFISAAVDSGGSGLWLGLLEGGLIRVSDAMVRENYSAATGLGAGSVNDIRTDADGAVWAATAAGLSRIHNRRVATLTSKNGLPCDGVHWSIYDDVGGVWLLTPCGLVRAPRADLDAWAAAVDKGESGSRTIRTAVFTDGIDLPQRATPFQPHVTKAPDGRIWFASADGVNIIDPRRLPNNPLAPPVHVERMIADRRAYLATTNVTLPPRIRDLEIDYTALSLVAPEKNRFRVKLEGRDRDWQDVGTRRQAFYSDLPPGSYTFRVKGSNNRGVWNEAGASLEFSVAPAYYQTRWFRLLSVATFLSLLWGAHRIRLRVVERHEAEISALNERLVKAQEQERIRIAGELHDGVMQQISAFVLLLGTAKRRMKLDLDAKADVASVQQKLIDLGSEVRQLSHDLHPPMLKEAGLPEALRAYCTEFSQTRGIPVTCEADESGSDLSRGSALALFRIAQEALGNAAKHAAPTRIEVRLTRTKSDAVLTVTDDGAGVDAVGVGTGLGLVSMRERARQLNGTFEFASKRGRGTTVIARVPFRPVSTPS